MKSRKGIYIGSWIVLVSLIVAGSIAAMSVQDLVSLEDNIREEALPIVASRITGSAYTLMAVEQGNIELKLTDEYSIWETPTGEIHLEYRDSELELDDYTNAIRLEESGTSSNWCLETQEEIIVLSEGSCR